MKNAAASQTNDIVTEDVLRERISFLEQQLRTSNLKVNVFTQRYNKTHEELLNALYQVEELNQQLAALTNKEQTHG